MILQPLLLTLCLSTAISSASPIGNHVVVPAKGTVAKASSKISSAVKPLVIAKPLVVKKVTSKTVVSPVKAVKQGVKVASLVKPKIPIGNNAAKVVKTNAKPISKTAPKVAVSLAEKKVSATPKIAAAAKITPTKLKSAVMPELYRDSKGYFDAIAFSAGRKSLIQPRSILNENFSSNNASESLKRRKRAASTASNNSPLASLDIGGNQFIPFIIDLAGHGIILNSYSPNAPHGFDTTKSRGGRDLQAYKMKPEVTMGYFGTNDLSLNTTVQGRLRRENIFFGHGPLRHAFAEIVFVIASNYIIAAGNAIIGLAPRIGPNGIRLMNPFPDLGVVGEGVTIGFSLLYWTVDTAVSAQNFIMEVELGGSDRTKYVNELEYFPVSDPKKFWSLDGDRVTVNGVESINQMGGLIFDTTDPIMYFQSALVVEIYAGVAGKVVQKLDNGDPLFLYPCETPPTISFSFASPSSNTQFTMYGDHFNAGFSPTNPGYCIGAIQPRKKKSKLPYNSVGLSFMKSFYTVYTYDSKGFPSHIGLSNTLPPL